MRRLVLHMGQTKTGSTAIQTWCVWNRDFLRARGVHYPGHRSDRAALRGTPLTGNGSVLLPFLGAPDRMDPDAAERGIDRVVAELVNSDAPATLCSNEKMWGQLKPTAFRELVDRFTAEGVTTQAVVYLRDIAPHAVAVYAQRVQQGGTNATLTEYITGEGGHELVYETRLQHTLELLGDVLGKHNITVRHYESARHALIDDLLTHVLGIEDRDGVQSPPQHIANRSLTLREIEWKRYLNERLGSPRQSKALGRKLTMLSGLDHDERLCITPAGLGHLTEHYEGEVAWVNRNYFNDRPILSVAGNQAAHPEPQQPVDLSAAECQLLDWLVAASNRQVR